MINKDQESALFNIDDDNFIGLQVVGGDFLEKTYKIHDKRIGVIIKARLKKRAKRN